MFAEQMQSPMSDTTVMVVAVCSVLTLVINAIVAPFVALWIARMRADLTAVKVQSETQAKTIETQGQKLDVIKEINENQTEDIKSVLAETNGLKKELVEATKSGALAEGKLAGIAEERAKVDEKK